MPATAMCSCSWWTTRTSRLRARGLSPAVTKTGKVSFASAAFFQGRNGEDHPDRPAGGRPPARNHFRFRAGHHRPCPQPNASGQPAGAGRKGQGIAGTSRLSTRAARWAIAARLIRNMRSGTAAKRARRAARGSRKSTLLMRAHMQSGRTGQRDNPLPDSNLQAGYSP